jgi:hypothetical protein
MGNFPTQKEWLASGGGSSAGNFPTQKEWKAQRKKRSRSPLEPFRDTEWYALEDRIKGLDSLIKNLYVEREVPKAEGNTAEVKKRGNVIESQKELRRLLNQLQDAKQNALRTDYLMRATDFPVDKPEEKGKATRYQASMKDLERLIRDFSKDYERRTEILPDLPAPGTGRASDEMLQELRDVEHGIMQKKLTQKVLTDIRTKEPLATESDLPPFIKKAINKSLKSEVDLMTQAAAVAGVNTPEEFKRLTGNKPTDYRSLMQKMWHSKVNPIRQGFNLQQAEVDILGGAAGGLFGMSGGGAEPANPVDIMAPEEAMRRQIERQQKVRQEYVQKNPWAEGKDPVRAAIEGATRAANNPWKGNPIAFGDFLDTLKYNVGPEHYIATNPYAKEVANLALEVFADPMNLVAMPGKLTTKGQNIKSIVNLVRQGQMLEGVEGAGKGAKYLGMAQDLADKIDFMGDIKKLDLSPTLAKRIKEKEAVLIGRRGRGRYAGARELPDFMAKAESAMVSPFSKVFQPIKETALGPVVRTFNPKSLMTPDIRYGHELARSIARHSAGEEERVVNELSRAYSKLSPQQKMGIFRHLPDPETGEVAARLGDLAKTTGLSDAERGILQFFVPDYSTHGYSGGKRTLRNLAQGAKQSDVPGKLKTFYRAAHDEDYIAALLRHDPKTTIKETQKGLRIQQRATVPYEDTTAVMSGSPIKGDPYFAKEKTFLDPLEAVEEFGATLETDPLAAFIGRLQASYAHRGTEAWKEIMSKRYGLAPNVKGAQELKRHHGYVPMGYRKGKLLDEPIETFTDHKTLRGLQIAKGREVKRIVPERIAKFLEAQYPSKGHFEYGNIPVFDALTNLFKASATAWRQGFHGRNLISNQWQKDIAGMQPLNPLRQYQANKLRRMIEKGDFTDDAIEAMSLGIKTGGVHGESGLDLQRRLETAGMTAGQKARRSLGKGLHPTSADFPLTVLGRMEGSAIENTDRLALYLDQIKHGVDPVSAAGRAQEFMFDYDDLSLFEKRVMKRLVPFYAWGRKNIPLQMKMLVQEPQKYAHAIRAGRALENMGAEKWGKEKIEQMEGFLPDYMKKMLAVRTPLESAGLPVYLNPNLPFQDLTKIIDPLQALDPEKSQDFLFNFNPVLKVPIGITMGAQARGMGYPQGTQSVSPQTAGVLRWLYRAMGKGEDEIPVVPGENTQTNLPTWYAPPSAKFALSQLPFLSDLDAILRTDRTDQPYQRMARLGGVKMMPFDWSREFEDRASDTTERLQDILRDVNKYGVYDTESEPFRQPKMMSPPGIAGSQGLWDFMQDRGIPITRAGVQRAVALWEQEKGKYYSSKPPIDRILKDLKKIRRVRIPIPLPSWDPTTGTWYETYNKQPSPVWQEGGY